MKIEIDLNEIFPDFEEDKSIADYISDSIKYKLADYVWNESKDQIKYAINTYMENEGKPLLMEKLNRELSNLIKEAKIPESNYSSVYISIEEWVKKVFNNNNNEAVLKRIVKEEANITANKMKERYDLLWASQFVVKMEENKMLREDIAKILLPDKK